MSKGSENCGSNGKRLLIPLQEAAGQLSMCRQTLIQYAGLGEIPVVKLGRKVYFRPGDLQEFVENNTIIY